MINKKERSRSEDIWSHFASFLAEMIARHAGELEVDSWMDPVQVLWHQKLRELYQRFVQLRMRKVKDPVSEGSIEMKVDLCYSPYIRTQDKKGNENDHQ